MHFSKYCLIFILFTQLGFSENTKHPNLLLNEKEIEDIRQNIKKHKWSRDLFTRLKTEVDKKSPGEKSGQGLSVAVRGTALMYAITKDKAYAEMAWKHLQGIIPSWTTGSNTGPYATGAEHAIMYDLIYTALTDEQRTSFEVAVKARGRHLINYANKGRQTWSMFFRFHSEVGVLGYLIGDKELIEWGLNDPGGGVFEKYGKKHYGGYYQMMEAIFRDGLFQSATTYGLVDVVPHMVILAEAAWHNGHDLWNWSSPEGDTLAKGFESWLDTTFPAEATTMGKGSFRIASYGDAGNHPEAGRDTYLFNYPHSIAVGHRNSEAGWLYEIAYKRTKNPKFAWIVNSRTRRGRSDYLFIYPALTHGVHVEPKDMILPKARSRVLADASNVMLRADESSNYWYGRGMACFMKMGNFPSYSHSSDDAYEIILHAKGRLIYPDVDVIQYENRSAIGWTAKTIAHNSLVVDGGNAMGAPFTYRNDFSDAVKFVSVTGAPYQKKGLSMDAAIGSRTYPKNVQLSRALFLTSDYMVDLFWAKSAKEHVYDWALHGMGRLIFDKKTYKRSDDLAPYKWIKDVYKNELATSWSVDWRQTDAGVKTDNKYYDERWFKSEVGVRMTMLGAPGTIAYAGEGPLYRTDLSSRADRLEGNMMKKRPAGAESRLPMVVARRKAKSVIFAALHEPYELAYAGKKLPAPKLAKSYELLAKTTTAIAVKVVGQDYVDYCMVRFKEDSKITQATPIPGILISELNKTWTFRTDPKKEGEVAKWQLPAHDASKWKKIKTDDVWEKQGYAKYNGIGWYRSTFTAAKTYKGKKLYLYFAGVDEDPKVWINGKLVGERHGIKFWNVPWHVEITDAIKLGEKNDIIVQVLDRSHAGGIYKAVSLVHSIEAIKKGTGNKQGDILTLVSNDGKLTFSFKDFGYIRIQGDKQIIKGSVKFTGLGKK